MTAKLISLLTRHCSLRISTLVDLLLTWQPPTAHAETSLQIPAYVISGKPNGGKGTQ